MILILNSLMETVDQIADSFDAFQIKISLTGYYQPYIPRVKDLRIIALA
jgi:hypothetical protein